MRRPPSLRPSPVFAPRSWRPAPPAREAAGPPPPLERIRAAAERHPSDYRAQMLLAFGVGRQRPDERRAALVRAAQLAPENPAVLNALAWHDLTHDRAPQALPL